MSAKLVGHWPLQDNAREISDSNLCSSARALNFRIVDGRRAAVFDGVSSHIEVDDHPEIRFNDTDFSLSLWLHTQDSSGGGDIVGDLISKFDPDKRRGMNLICSTHTGVTQTTQSNYRHLQFGVDCANLSPQWIDCGRPGNAVMVCALAAVNGALHAGTFEHGPDMCGHLWRYQGDNNWVDLGAAPPGCNSIPSLACFDGDVFCATGRYNPNGSQLGNWKNVRPGGQVYRVSDDGQWDDCGHPGADGAKPDDISDNSPRSDQADETTCLTVYRGHLYAVSNHRRGLYRYDGGKNWKYVGPNLRIMSVTLHQGQLYALINGGGVYRFDGDNSWVWCGEPTGSTQTYCAVTYQGKLLVGTWPEGEVVRYDGGEAWSVIGRLGYEREVMGTALYNGKCYFGSLPMANIFRMDHDRFTFLGNIDNDPTVMLRRAWSMAVHRGEMFAGSLPQGRVSRRRAGCMATHDHALPSGWRHIAAVRRDRTIMLYLDGVVVAQNEMPNGGEFPLDTHTPLRIGAGIGHHLNGALADVRIYNGALNDADISGLHAAG